MKEIELNPIDIDKSADGYMPSDELISALEIAYTLKRPLLLSGAPGAGKTDFAKWVAKSLKSRGFADKPFVYATKSSSVSSDLFYYYDAVSHFRDNRPHFQDNVKETKTTAIEKITDGNPTIIKTDSVEQEKVPARPQLNAADYIQLKALGLAFARAIGCENAGENKALFEKSGVPAQPTSSVVLIDEIDKASRDFPNDLLNELEDYVFEIKELNRKIELKDKEPERLIIILTSNFEKSLPEPFLRRCIYFHIDFPSRDRLVEIVMSRLKIDNKHLNDITNRIDDFFIIYNYELQKKPSTSECIDWIRSIMKAGVLSTGLFAPGKSLKDSPLKAFFPILLKKQEDLEFVLDKTF
ncbi:AAA family ATPase [Mucilaginibacter celer]|nr:MoxR family ATPase [Mucilaginibacter celer]